MERVSEESLKISDVTINSLLSDSFQSQDYRSKLYTQLNEKAILEPVKVYLRSKLVQELFRIGTPGQALSTKDRDEFSQNKTSTEGESTHSAWAGVSQALVVDYLESLGVEYTLSVFFLESGAQKKSTLGREELADILRIIFTSNSGCLLSQILSKFVKDHGNEKRDIHTQTLKNHPHTLEEKLMEVERAFTELSQKESEHNRLAMQEKMLNFEKQCQQYANDQVRSEVAKFKERELSALRLEFEHKSQEDANASRRHFEQLYQEKMVNLQEKELSLQERAKRRENEFEQVMYSQRQKLLDELEIVRKRESEARKVADKEEMSLKLEKDHLKAMEEQLKLKELALETTAKQSQLEAEEKLFLKESEMEKSLIERGKIFDEQERKLKEERLRVKELESRCNSYAKENSDYRTQLAKLQDAIHVTTQAQLGVEKEKQILEDKFEIWSDYPILLSNTTRLESELLDVQNQLDQVLFDKEQQNGRYELQLTQLKNKLQLPSDEERQLKEKLLQQKHRLEREKMAYQHEIKELKLQIVAYMQHHNNLKGSLIDHQNLVSQLNQELSHLKLQQMSLPKPLTDSKPQYESTLPGSNLKLKSSLRQTFSGSNDQFNNNNSKVSLKSVYSRPTNRVRIKLPHSNMEDNSLMNDSVESKTSVCDLTFVHQARASLSRLEKEAEHLEQSYKAVHKRILQPNYLNNNNNNINNNNNNNSNNNNNDNNNSIKNYPQSNNIISSNITNLYTSTIDPTNLLDPINTPNLQYLESNDPINYLLDISNSSSSLLTATSEFNYSMGLGEGSISLDVEKQNNIDTKLSLSSSLTDVTKLQLQSMTSLPATQVTANPVSGAQMLSNGNNYVQTQLYTTDLARMQKDAYDPIIDTNLSEINNDSNNNRIANTMHNCDLINLIVPTQAELISNELGNYSINSQHHYVNLMETYSTQNEFSAINNSNPLGSDIAIQTFEKYYDMQSMPLLENQTNYANQQTNENILNQLLAKTESILSNPITSINTPEINVLDEESHSQEALKNTPREGLITELHTNQILETELIIPTKTATAPTRSVIMPNMDENLPITKSAEIFPEVPFPPKMSFDEAWKSATPLQISQSSNSVMERVRKRAEAKAQLLLKQDEEWSACDNNNKVETPSEAILLQPEVVSAYNNNTKETQPEVVNTVNNSDPDTKESTNQPSDAMRRYLEILSTTQGAAKNLTNSESFLTGSNIPIITQFPAEGIGFNNVDDINKSELDGQVSYGGFSDDEKNNIFADWD